MNAGLTTLVDNKELQEKVGKAVDDEHDEVNTLNNFECISPPKVCTEIVCLAVDQQVYEDSGLRSGTGSSCLPQVVYTNTETTNQNFVVAVIQIGCALLS